MFLKMQNYLHGISKLGLSYCVDLKYFLSLLVHRSLCTFQNDTCLSGASCLWLLLSLWSSTDKFFSALLLFSSLFPFLKKNSFLHLFQTYSILLRGWLWNRWFSRLTFNCSYLLNALQSPGVVALTDSFSILPFGYLHC